MLLLLLLADAAAVWHRERAGVVEVGLSCPAVYESNRAN
jgi:hypothetical protein